MSVESIYLTVLIVSGILVLLYILFGDVLDGIGEGVPFLNPVLILVFLVFLSATGYILELINVMNSFFILLVSAIGSFILTTLLNLFVLVPLSSAEESLAYSEESLKGRIGTIIVPIPKDGFGEVLFESKSGRIAKAATSYDGTEIEEGLHVLVVDVKDGVVYVKPYDERSLYRSDF
ncbi:hypothetical protein OE105_00990 [Fervidibacillus halotolerans]|uniref:Membrane protein NfeD2 N-terminal transmembrane domain-containing protein n=2 Tax=Fervidibacillus halotolerans TaxID=2980027 RepID=A0A9E8RYY7_9BACI|nr:hypothetical protein [Fervidibacillus halotolerans]WAA12753.1 hypothetical protein OE105_00990 [Fervidibacillus halotolerans]